MIKVKRTTQGVHTHHDDTLALACEELLVIELDIFTMLPSSIVLFPTGLLSSYSDIEYREIGDC